MKKSLQLLLVAGVMFMVTTPTVTLTKETDSEEVSKKGRNSNNKRTEQSSKKERAKKSSQSPKDKMHKFQKELADIKKDFKADGDVAAANKRLDAMPAKIKEISSCMKKSEEHGSMWETHKHTMERELRSTRKFVNETK